MIIGTNIMVGDLLSLGEVIGASMVYGFVVIYFADLLDLPEWARNYQYMNIYLHIRMKKLG